MTDRFEFVLVFALPKGEFDPLDLTDAVFQAGFEDPLVGTGIPGLLAIELETETDGGTAEDSILAAARSVLPYLPVGTSLREIRPDLVSLADVAEKLNIRRQALQQREMPLPSLGGLYRIDELEDALARMITPDEGKRRPRFDLGPASSWLRAGRDARRINAMLTTGELDPFSLEKISGRRQGEHRAAS